MIEPFLDHCLLLCFPSTYQAPSIDIRVTKLYICCFDYVTHVASDIMAAIKGFKLITILKIVVVVVFVSKTKILKYLGLP